MRELLFFLFTILFSCVHNDKEIKQGIIDPNDASEMALMMRDMFNQLEMIKNKIESGEDISNELLQFIDIHKTKATDESFVIDDLKRMSIGFKKVVEKFNKLPSKRNYNLIVNNCISCHQGLCPGPLDRIDNLILIK
tara:strand:+ start:48 stop:458 length:411 start_codon:yes stop_codon:yes gene_type:complete